MKTVKVTRDPLTGLSDRSLLDTLEDRFRNRSQPWSMIIIDIDHFKLVNDVYGHLTGDDIISHVGRTISVNLKRNDFALRYGGDEFLAILPSTGGNSALDLAQRLLFELGSREFPGGLRISVSMGIAESRPDDGDMKSVLARADQALYRAKETGRGRFVLADNLLLRREVEPDFTHMVGRREELQVLRDLLDSASEGKPTVCALTGYQGTGKTRLVDELGNYCSFRGIPLLRTEVHPIREEYGFLAVSAVRKALDSLSEKELQAVLKAIGELEASTVEHLCSYGFRIRKRALPSDSDEAWIRSRHDIAAVIRATAAVRPLVLVLDNLQNASAESIRYFSEVLIELNDAAVLTIVIAREPAALEPMDPLLENSTRIHLKPLSRTDIRTMLFFALKSPGVPDDVLDYMVTQSGGNTLFLRKLIRWCIEKGYLSVGEGDLCTWQQPEEGEVPEAVAGIAEGMLKGVQEDDMRVLRRAAIAGRALNLRLLNRLTGMGELTLAEVLDSLVGKGLLQDDGEYYTFTFGVMRSCLLSRISPSLRMILHEKAARSLEEQWSEDDHLLLESIAEHYLNGRDQKKALTFAGMAAKKMFSLGLHSKAIHWYREYLHRLTSESDQKEFFRANLNIGTLFSITGKADEAEHHLRTALELAESPVDRCGVHYRLGDNYKRKSAYQEALECYSRTIEIGTASDDRGSVMLNNVLGALLEHSFISRLQNRHEEARRKLQEAWSILEAGQEGVQPGLEALYYARLADVESETGEPEKALDHYRTGLDIAIRYEDINSEALILNNMHSLFSLSGDYTSMLDTLKEVVKLNNRLDDQLGLAIAYYNLAESYISMNMLDLARRYFQLYIELNSRIENRLGMGYGQLGMGKLLSLEEKYELAEKYFLNASDIFEELSCTEMRCETMLQTAMVRLRTGELSEAEKIIDSVEGLCESEEFSNIISHIRGYLKVMTGDSVDRGIFLVESSIVNAEDLSPFDIAFMYGNLYRAYTSAGREEQALHALSNGVEVLDAATGMIKTDSIRNGILSRRDIQEYLTICREQGVACTVGSE